MNDEELKWSVAPPTVAGWYWWRPAADRMPGMACVLETLAVRFGIELWQGGPERMAAEMGGEWAGPLQPPD